MGMCKACSNVVSSLEIKEGLCKECQSIGTLDFIERKNKEEKLESEKALKALKGELIYEVHTTDNRGIAILIMIVSIGGFVMIYQHFNTILFMGIVGIGLMLWFRSNKSFLKVYQNCLDIDDVLIDKENVISIEIEKNECRILTKSEVWIDMSLKNISPSYEEELSVVLKKWINNEELFNSSLVKTEEKPLIINEDEELSDSTYRIVKVVIITLFVTAVIFLVSVNK